MPDRATADAPGRVNLIGEHTDYHQGFVLPTITPQRTTADVQLSPGRRVRATTDRAPGAWIEYELGSETRTGGWIDYVQGVTSALLRRGFDVPGFTLRLSSTVPPGAGVSSSAALEVSVLRALRLAAELCLDDVALARVAQSAETDFVGAPVGIMDQMASSLGEAGAALFLDTRTLATERVPIPPEISIGAIDSGVPHEHASGLYGARRRESFEAARQLGVTWLRDVAVEDLPRINALPRVLAKRARHVVTENARVLDTVAALRRGDARRVGALFNASHASMRDDYETSTPEIDHLVRIAVAHPSVYGARLTGGGFGGAIVLAVDASAVDPATSEICAEYGRATGREGRVLMPPRARDAQPSAS